MDLTSAVHVPNGQAKSYNNEILDLYTSEQITKRNTGNMLVNALEISETLLILKTKTQKSLIYYYI